MTLRPWMAVGLAAAAAAFWAGATAVTGFVACGVSGCGGGGFGPAYAPVQAQLGLLACGVVPAVVTAVLLRRRGAPTRAGAGVVALLAAAVLAMLVLGLGPNGCPSGQSRAVTGPGGFDPGSPTCSADPDAVPR